MKKSIYFCLFLCLGLFSCQKENINVSSTDRVNPVNDSPFATVVVSVQQSDRGDYSGTGGGGCNTDGVSQHSAITNAQVMLYRSVAGGQNNETLPEVASGNTGEVGQTVFRDLEPEEYLIVVRSRLGEKSQTVKTAKGTSSLVVFNF